MEETEKKKQTSVVVVEGRKQSKRKEKETSEENNWEKRENNTSGRGREKPTWLGLDNGHGRVRLGVQALGLLLGVRLGLELCVHGLVLLRLVGAEAEAARLGAAGLRDGRTRGLRLPPWHLGLLRLMRLLLLQLRLGVLLLRLL